MEIPEKLKADVLEYLDLLKESEKKDFDVSPDFIKKMLRQSELRKNFAEAGYDDVDIMDMLLEVSVLARPEEQRDGIRTHNANLIRMLRNFIKDKGGRLPVAWSKAEQDEFASMLKKAKSPMR